MECSQKLCLRYVAITYHLGGPQIDEEIVIQMVVVDLGVVSVRQTILVQPALQN